MSTLMMVTFYQAAEVEQVKDPEKLQKFIDEPEYGTSIAVGFDVAENSKFLAITPLVTDSGSKNVVIIPQKSIIRCEVI